VAVDKDCWAEWLVRRPYGGDQDVQAKFEGRLAKRRDRILDNANLVAGETLLDVGCGEGLVAFGALDRGAAQVIFSDISGDLLDVCREAAAALDVLERCHFVEAPADDLSPIADGSVDVVTTRSVLIYVRDKGGAFREFYRVLRPGGRISLYEPINRFAAARDGFFGPYDIRAIPEIAAKLNAVYDAIQPPDTDPMIDFDERDLVRLAEEVGFHPIELHYEAEIRPIDALAWDVFCNQAGNPRIPTLGEAMADALTDDERQALTAAMKPLVEQGMGNWRMGHAFLVAIKPTT
jgi:ubiquinone/menaquinone biosynthesis C-methylase UbiE